MKKRDIHNWAYHNKSKSIEDKLPRWAKIFINIIATLMWLIIIGAVALYIISELLFRFG